MTFMRMMNMQNTYLVHHGIKGMKWGVRSAETLRKYGVGGKSSGKNKAGVVATIKARREARKPTFEQRRETALTTHSAKKLAKNMDTLSDKELQQRYNRLNMEQNVRNLSRQNQSIGRNIVRDSGQELAKDLVKQYAKKGAVAVLGVAGTYALSKAGPKAIGAGVNLLTKVPGKW